MQQKNEMNETRKPAYEGFTLSLALVDAIPVLLFGGSSILLGILFGSPLFIVGAVLVFLGGFFKVLWKVLLATAGKDVSIFNKQMKYTMMTGFLLIIISVIANAGRLSFAAIWKGVTSMPSLIFFLLGLAGMTMMGVFAKKLDPKVARNNWIEQCTNGFAQLCIFLGLLFLL